MLLAQPLGKNIKLGSMHRCEGSAYYVSSELPEVRATVSALHPLSVICQRLIVGDRLKPVVPILVRRLANPKHHHRDT